MSLLNVTNVSHGFGERVILKNASFRLLKGEHIGLVGANGEGKSTFINILMGKELPEEGKIEWAKHLKVGYLDQFSSLIPGVTIRETLRTAFKDMFLYEEEINNLYMQMGEMTEEEMNEALEEIGEMQSYLENSGFYLIDSKIEEVAFGLGLKEIGLDSLVDELSGGQRAKVLLTKLLLENPQVLILDEPTNFLDEIHVTWLKNYLLNFENAFIVISHDEIFLNEVVNVIYHIDNGVLTRYSGNLDYFKQAYEVKMRQLDAAYEAQQKEIAKMEDFIARNKARVATRSMANSRQKKLDKMELIDKGKEKIKPHFVFKFSKTTGKVLFRCEDLVIGYDKPLSKPINLEILRGERVVIKGSNGIGKTTLVKSLIGDLKPISGNVIKSPAVDINYFEQEAPGNRNTPFEEIRDSFPTLNNGEIHYFLSASGLTNQNIESQIITLSGGEAAKVRLCKLTIQDSNCLILDEPTNHLDVLAKEALKEAIEEYEGTVILVCHEPDFYEGLNFRVIDAEKHSI
ncbi:MAG: ABC-F family ATP-binding cassette domain-containing protein [Bacilli bacterium]|nr:ABC-F family ATP-binding cassette domain-containing protein [Bacilli bacterium]